MGAAGVHNVHSDGISDILGVIYGAASGEAEWLTAIAGLRDLFGGSSANFVRHGPDIGPQDLIATETDPVFQERFVAEFASETNPFIQRAMQAEAGKVFTDRTLFDREELRASRYWNEWMAPQDMYSGMFCKVWASDTSIWAFNVQRGCKQEEFGRAEVALLERLLPHLNRAMRISRYRLTAQALSSAFYQLPFGILLVGADQHIIEMNELAERLLSRPDSRLRIEAGRLVPTCANAGEMRAAIAQARLAPSLETPGGFDFLVRQPATNGASGNLLISVMPLANRKDFGPAWEPMAAVILREVVPRLPEGFDAHLRAIFNLTPAEARLAANLCSGQSLKSSAGLQDIRFSTARHYLENIFQKTGTRQQSQLVALLKNVQPLQRR
jgi:DNA-binding CsgD family transcriptional regulator/PAS domain-containing protein